MAYVNTLLGPIHPAELGPTAVHEHILWGPQGWELNPEYWFNFGKSFEESYSQLMDFKLVGGQTFIDCSGIGMGRDLDVYIKMAESVRQLNIIASTGTWADERMAPYFRNRDIDYFEALFVHELTEGIGHSAVKAGVITIGGGEENGANPFEAIVCRAAAKAARKTGAPLITFGAFSPLKRL
jgi:predicted metal-dependent phosphotriesterase family hydrolase